MKLPVPNNMVGRPSEDSLVRLPESAFAVVAASDAEEGSTTVEYALGAVATAAFAGLLLAVLKSGGVKGMLTSIIQSALSHTQSGGGAASGIFADSSSARRESQKSP